MLFRSAQYYLGLDVVAQLMQMHPLDCAGSAYRHEYRCLYGPVVCLYHTGTRSAVGTRMLECELHLEKLVGVYASVVQRLEIGHYGGAVLGICHAEPARGGGKHIHCRLAALDELVDHRGNEELALGLVAVFAKEFNELVRAVSSKYPRRSGQQNKNFVDLSGGSTAIFEELSLSVDYRTEAPPILRDFLVYHETIQGHSRKTVDEYYLDLRNFFRFLKQSKNLVPKDTPLDNVSIDDVDLSLVRDRP